MSNSANQLLNNRCFNTLVNRLEREYFERWQVSQTAEQREQIKLEQEALTILILYIESLALEHGEQDNAK